MNYDRHLARMSKASDEQAAENDGAFRVVVLAFDLDLDAQDALFDRVADAAHALDEQVMCSSSGGITPGQDAAS